MSPVVLLEEFLGYLHEEDIHLYKADKKLSGAEAIEVVDEFISFYRGENN